VGAGAGGAETEMEGLDFGVVNIGGRSSTSAEEDIAMGGGSVARRDVLTSSTELPFGGGAEGERGAAGLDLR
jgi:hypothetical protein